jgi:hypothetical protein
MPDLPQELLHALIRGDLTSDQLVQLLEAEATALGLSLEEAVRLARARQLPRDRNRVVADDFEMLVEMLPAT